MNLLATLLLLTTAGAAATVPPAPSQQQAPSAREQAVLDAEAVAREMMKVQDGATELACPKAVQNARYSVETMLEVGTRNVQGGYLEAAEFDKAAVPLRAMLPLLTVADCEAASGNKRAFYQCMSSDYNHALACGKAHPF
ncbi:hypothetical protein KQ945_03055 [Bacillus subtilis subsp. subtilis]|nr:hypothetical protein [Bacillus subtilis subsp. subtilis]